VDNTSIRDVVVGAFVLAGIAAVAYLSIQVGGLSYKGPGGLQLVAYFDEIGGLADRAPVVIAGVKVGQVKGISLAPDMRAKVVLDLDSTLELPVDTSASIRTAGLLGSQFIALQPGGEAEMLKSGDVIDFTESALNLEKLIGTLIHDTDVGGSD